MMCSLSVVYFVGFMFVMCIGLALFFFFQAEDGIRDLVRSRGLGDVYKRQLPNWLPATCLHQRLLPSGFVIGHGAARPQLRLPPVSYTHLTLPTSDLV